MKTIKNTIATLAAAILLTTACTDNAGLEPTRTEITIGHIEVAGTTADTRTATRWTTTGDPFQTDDRLHVATPTATIWIYEQNGTWKLPTGTALYKEDLGSIIEFTANKGVEGTNSDQGTAAKYRNSDYITGNLKLTGNVLATAAGAPFIHEHVDVVIHITPAGTDNWAGVDFVEYMSDPGTVVRFHTENGNEITPYPETFTPQAATYRAVIPYLKMPDTTRDILSITVGGATVTGKYSNVTGGTLAPGSRLTLTFPYENKRLLAPTATVSKWEPGPTYPVQTAGYDMIITNEADLRALARLVNSGTLPGVKAIQVADITLTDKWTPIGDVAGMNKFFTGVYNGGGHTIAGLEIDGGTAGHQGLFGAALGATITGVNLVAPRVSGGDYVGALAGGIFNAQVSNCSAVDVSVSGATDSTGGLIGINVGMIVACFVEQANGSSTNSGYLAGGNTGDIAFSYSTGKLTNNTGGGTIRSCYDLDTTDNTAPDTPERENITPVPDIPIGITETRTIDATIWGPGEQPKLIW